MTSAFKKMIENDTKIFLNIDEFGEVANIDGDDILVMIDNDIINKRPRLFSTGTDPYAQGVYQSLITFFVKKVDLGYTPVEGQDIRFNGKVSLVKSVSDNLGIFEITLESNET
ncbi:hypothetical protein BVG16_16370 [Paenibacillus selenitireducens]|uniref:Uncharacterized protein n=1 Tax=Paenibacillus selenitireducens TaxID=1324314 RepID=A0A1T2XA87_9BACL|nr:hypothetical protein [Paenibacillus selenitireducens]OPA76745.1 hypothetical protein BVG16_16370 [Paenibacillus selenitireducens]